MTIQKKPNKVFYFKPPKTFEEYKAMVNAFSMHTYGKPAVSSDEEIREKWEEYQSSQKTAKPQEK